MERWERDSHCEAQRVQDVCTNIDIWPFIDV